MKVIVACLFAFFVASSAMETSFMNTLQADIAALLEKDGATIGGVLKLLRDLKAHEQNDLKELIQKWEKVDQPRHLRLIAQAQKALDDKIAECNAIETLIHAQEKEKATYEENIHSAETKIEENNKRVASREDKRCKNNLLFLDKVRQARQVRKFLVYLVKQMSKKSFQKFVTSQPTAFLSLREVAVHQHDNSIAELTKIHLMSTFFETEAEADPHSGYTDEELDKKFNVSARTKAEIGTGHIDNDKKDLTLEGYNYTEETAGDFITMTIKFLGKLIAEIDANIKELRENEEEAVAAFQKFRLTIEMQNHVLTLYIAHCKEFVAKLVTAIAANKVELKKCRDEIPPLRKELAEREAAYKKAYNAYMARRKNLEHIIPLIQKAIDIYLAKVNAAGKEYHERVRDYAADQKFDKTNAKFEHRTDFEYKKP